MNLKKNIHIYIGLLFIVIHLAGAIGLMSEYRLWFQRLTPVTLLFSFYMLLRYHENINLRFIFLTSIVVIGGLLIEIIGVNTGFPFGEYWYDWVLGLQIFGVPIVIGFNWFLLTYLGAYLFQNATEYLFLNSILSGVFITLLDVIIEPVAIRTDYWTWQMEAVPIQNYITWFVSIAFFTFVLIRQGKLKNKLAPWLLISQVLFFAILCVYYLK